MIIKEKSLNFSMLTGGIILFLGGFIINNEGVRKLSIGIGAILLLMLLFKCLISKFESLDPTYKKAKEIEIKDERNILIKEKSAYKAFMTLAFILEIALFVGIFLELNLALNPLITNTLFAVIVLQGVLYLGYYFYYKKSL